MPSKVLPLAHKLRHDALRLFSLPAFKCRLFNLSRYTALFEALVIQWLKEASIQAVSRQLQLSWTAIDGIMKRAVRRGLAARTSPDVRFLSVDETAFRKGHDYVTILSNHQGQVVIVEDGKSADSLSRCYLALTEAQRASIESV